MNKELETNSINMLVENVKKDVECGSLLLNHPLQRKAQQWTARQKGNFVRRILSEQHILPLNICTQRDPITNYEYQYLIDGKQRVTTLNEYIEDGFAISTQTSSSIIRYSGVKYETRERNGKKVLLYKRDKNTKKIIFTPVLDENGCQQYGEFEIDIRGLKFSQLPPELQERIKRYNFPVLIKRNCSDEEIQQEIIDFNSGSAMNKEQMGINLLGTNWAAEVATLSNSSFIKDCCTFTRNDEVKSKIERSIVETLCLIYFEWKNQYDHMCSTLVDRLSKEHIDQLNGLFSEMYDVVNGEPEVINYIDRNEFHIVLACFYYFKSLSYNNVVFKRFLKEWVNTLRFEKNIEADDEFISYVEAFGKGKTGTKTVGVVTDKLNEINKALDNFLNAECDDLVENDYQNKEALENDFISNENLLSNERSTLFQNYYSKFQESNLASFVPEVQEKNLSARCLMMTVQSPFFDFTSEYLEKFTQWFDKNGNIDMSEYCLIYADQLSDILLTLDVNSSRLNINTLPFLLFAVKHFNDVEEDEYLEDWLKLFMTNEMPDEECLDSANITAKTNFVERSIIEYLKSKTT